MVLLNVCCIVVYDAGRFIFSLSLSLSISFSVHMNLLTFVPCQIKWYCILHCTGFSFLLFIFFLFLFFLFRFYIYLYPYRQCVPSFCNENKRESRSPLCVLKAYEKFPVSMINWLAFQRIIARHSSIWKPGTQHSQSFCTYTPCTHINKSLVTLLYTVDKCATNLDSECPSFIHWFALLRVILSQRRCAFDDERQNLITGKCD